MPSVYTFSRNKMLAGLVLVATTATVLAALSLSVTQFQQLLLVGMIVFLGISLFRLDFRSQLAILPIVVAAIFIIGSLAPDPVVGWSNSFPLVVTAPGLLVLLCYRHFPLLIGGSAGVLGLLSIGAVFIEPQTIDRVTGCIAAIVAAICVALALATGVLLGRVPLAFTAYLGAALAFAAFSLELRSTWLTAGLLMIAIGVILDTHSRHRVALIDQAWNPVERPLAVLGGFSLVTGIPAITIALVRGTPLLWSFAGAISIGIVGLGATALLWWSAYEFRLDRLEGLALESRIDQLTGLHNRRGLDERIAEEFSRSRRYDHPLSILLLDLDDFKTINDRFGHSVGDDVLRTVASILGTAIRSIDLAGRYGGEEFLIVLPETDRTGARIVAERIRTSIEGSGLVTASIGIGELIPEDMDVSRLVVRADRALYTAKRTGKNQVV